MAIRLGTNIASLAATNELARNQRGLRQSTRKLSSGVRISQAADAAAQLGVSEKMRAHIASHKIALRNANDGISMIQVGEAAWGETTQVLTRMRELAVESSSEVLQEAERNYLATEFVTLQDELDRLALTTEFNGLDLGRGTTGIVGVQVGIFGGSTNNRISVRFGNMMASSLTVDAASANVYTPTEAQDAIGNIDFAIDRANFFRSDLASNQNRLMAALRNTETALENLVEAESRIRDVDVAEESATYTRGQVFQNAGVALLSQANSSPRAALALLS